MWIGGNQICVLISMEHERARRGDAVVAEGGFGSRNHRCYHL